MRRATMLAGFTSEVAAIAARGGRAALEEVRLVVGRPLRPMLAASAKTTGAAVEGLGGGTLLVDGKLDGIRVQVHRAGGEVTVFTRSLDEITERVPEVAEAVAGLPGGDLVLDGEAIVIGGDGRPAPFQVTGSRTASSADVARLREELPLTTYLFDVLHRDGRDLVDPPRSSGTPSWPSSRPPARPAARHRRPSGGRAFFDELVAAGHEGVVVKDGAAPYAAGRRGSGWVKVKPSHTVDLVVLGRRVGVRAAHRLALQHPPRRPRPRHRRLRHGRQDVQGDDRRDAGVADQAVHRARHRRRTTAGSCRCGRSRSSRSPSTALQRSTRYPGGVALRFARVLRYRDDKGAEEADTIGSLQGCSEAPRRAPALLTAFSTDLPSGDAEMPPAELPPAELPPAELRRYELEAGLRPTSAGARHLPAPRASRGSRSSRSDSGSTCRVSTPDGDPWTSGRPCTAGGRALDSPASGPEHSAARWSRRVAPAGRARAAVPASALWASGTTASSQ